jgi:benzodiazapine receptor
MKKYIQIFLPLILGFLVSLLTKNDMYSNIIKPVLSPPAIVFPIMWTILYLIMGYTYYKVDKSKVINIFYYLQLFVNLIWTIIFFKFKLYTFAYIWLILLITLVTTLLINYYKQNKKIAYANIPYLLWLLFALYLNISISILN